MVPGGEEPGTDILEWWYCHGGTVEAKKLSQQSKAFKVSVAVSVSVSVSVFVAVAVAASVSVAVSVAQGLQGSLTPYPISGTEIPCAATTCAVLMSRMLMSRMLLRGMQY
eukprot:1665455-Rhodomonas_salina.1